MRVSRGWVKCCGRAGTEPVIAVHGPNATMFVNRIGAHPDNRRELLLRFESKAERVRFAANLIGQLPALEMMDAIGPERAGDLIRTLAELAAKLPERGAR